MSAVYVYIYVETYLSVAFSSLGAIDSPSSRLAGMPPRSTLNSDLGSAAGSWNRSTSWLDEPDSKYEMLKNRTTTNRMDAVRC